MSKNKIKPDFIAAIPLLMGMLLHLIADEIGFYNWLYLAVALGLGASLFPFISKNKSLTVVRIILKMVLSLMSVVVCTIWLVPGLAFIAVFTFYKN
jgi:hypothetical protein